MEPETTNNRLLIRALDRMPGDIPGSDFTRRIMERIEREATRKRRRENRLLLTGVVACALGLILFGGIVVHTYADSGLFSSLGAAFSRMTTVFAGVVRDVEPGAASHPVSSENNSFLLWIWGYSALLFLLFGVVEQLLRRKRL